jgi:hypothetical protein
MAIPALSAIGGGSFPGFRVGATITGFGPLGRLGRVEAVPALEGRASSEHLTSSQSANPTEKDGHKLGVQREKDSGALFGAIDPRGPESIIARRGENEKVLDKKAADEASKREIKERLGELMGEKSSLVRKQAEDKGARSSEIVSELAQMKARDSEVRAHESAHMAAGGRYITGGASYSYQKGPDGGQYAVGGEVGIDSSPVPGKPEETVAKMRIVRAAALAPSDPSAADLAVAASAAQTEAAALADIAQERSEEASRSSGVSSGTAAGAASYAKEGAAGGPRERDGIFKSALDMVA